MKVKYNKKNNNQSSITLNKKVGPILNENEFDNIKKEPNYRR